MRRSTRIASHCRVYSSIRVSRRRVRPLRFCDGVDHTTHTMGVYRPQPEAGTVIVGPSVSVFQELLAPLDARFAVRGPCEPTTRTHVAGR